MKYNQSIRNTTKFVSRAVRSVNHATQAISRTITPCSQLANHSLSGTHSATHNAIGLSLRSQYTIGRPCTFGHAIHLDNHVVSHVVQTISHVAQPDTHIVRPVSHAHIQSVTIGLSQSVAFKSIEPRRTRTLRLSLLPHTLIMPSLSLSLVALALS